MGLNIQSVAVVMCTCQQLFHLCKNYFITILQYTKNTVLSFNCSIPHQTLYEDNKKRVTEALKILDTQQIDKVHPRSLETNHETVSGGSGGGDDDNDDDDDDEEEEEEGEGGGEEEEHNSWKFTSTVIFTL